MSKLFHYNGKYGKVFDRIRCFFILKGDISYVVSHKYEKIKIGSDDDLSLEKTVTMYNVITLRKSVFNENHNHYYYKVLLEKCSYKQYEYTFLDRIDVFKGVEIDKVSRSRE